jgi:hypothetical protein
VEAQDSRVPTVNLRELRGTAPVQSNERLSGHTDHDRTGRWQLPHERIKQV